jgi:hypothetical protein
MIISHKVPDFGFSSELNEADQMFGIISKIIAYVEAFDDVRFWTERFAAFEVDVEVNPISNDECANGKDIIISAIREGRIVLGIKQLVCLDSDYDYLLVKNTDIYTSPFCFQTYTYAIENYNYNPVQLTNYCCKAANYYKGVEINLFQSLFEGWSESIYGIFLKLLLEDNDYEKNKALINSSLNELSFDNPINNIEHDFVEEDYKHFTEKGLLPNNVFLYFRGHCLEAKIIKLAKEIVHQLSEKAKNDIMGGGSDNHGQLIKEYYNTRLEFKALINGRENHPDNFCYDLLKTDIEFFKNNHT